LSPARSSSIIDLLGHFIEGLSAYAVVFLEGLVDLDFGSQGELDRGSRIELDGAEHAGVEGIADDDLECAVLEVGGDGEILKGDLGGDLVASLGWDSELSEVDKGPIQDDGQLLEKELLGGAGLTTDELQQAVLRTVRSGQAPLLLPVVHLPRGGVRGSGDDVFERDVGHENLLKPLRNFNNRTYGKFRRGSKYLTNPARHRFGRSWGDLRGYSSKGWGLGS